MTAYLIPRFHSDSEGQRYVAALTTERLKELWDAFDDWHQYDPGCYVLNAIHLEMNKRGEGAYVAV